MPILLSALVVRPVLAAMALGNGALLAILAYGALAPAAGPGRGSAAMQTPSFPAAEIFVHQPSGRSSL